MIKTIEKKICDVCKQEVKDFAGSLFLKYSDKNFTGCDFPVEFEYNDVCIDCCRKIDKFITSSIKIGGLNESPVEEG